MSDPKSVAARYLDAWNEADADRRARLLREHWADDARYVDPLMRGDGLQQIDALIAAVHARFPGFRFALRTAPTATATTSASRGRSAPRAAKRRSPAATSSSCATAGSRA
jgi:hypothetical protein